jgi:hypothetical protein
MPQPQVLITKAFARGAAEAERIKHLKFLICVTVRKFP